MSFINSGDGKSTRTTREYTGKKFDRYEEERKLFGWKETLEGQLGLCALNFIVLVQATEDDLRLHTLKNLNISVPNITKWLILVFPELDEAVRKVNGEGLTVSMVRGRIHNMIRDNKTKQAVLGPEYPKTHRATKDLYPLVQRHMKCECLMPGSLSILYNKLRKN